MTGRFYDGAFLWSREGVISVCGKMGRGKMCSGL